MLETPCVRRAEVLPCAPAEHFPRRGEEVGAKLLCLPAYLPTHLFTLYFPLPRDISSQTVHYGWLPYASTW